MKKTDKDLRDEIRAHIVVSANDIAEIIHEERPQFQVEDITPEVTKILIKKFAKYLRAKRGLYLAFANERANPTRMNENDAQNEHGYFQYVARETKWRAEDTRTVVFILKDSPSRKLTQEVLDVIDCD
jgi:hypothetical protein